MRCDGDYYALLSTMAHRETRQLLRRIQSKNTYGFGGQNHQSLGSAISSLSLRSDSTRSKKLESRNWTQTLTDVSVAREPQACSLINGEKLLLQDSTLKYQCVVFFSCSSTFLTKKKKKKFVKYISSMCRFSISV